MTATEPDVIIPRNTVVKPDPSMTDPSQDTLQDQIWLEKQEAREAALEQAMQHGADLAPFSDGRDWHEQLVLDEIYHYAKAEMMTVYEIGRRLIWTKRTLPHGAWGPWCETHLPWNQRRVQQMMQVAAWLVPHQRLMASSGRLGISKLLELVKLPPELEAELTETGEIGGVSVEDMASMTYTEVKKHLTKEKKRTAKLEDSMKRLEQEKEAAEERAIHAEAAMGRLVSADDKAVLEIVTQLHKQLDDTVISVGFQLDQLARRMDDFPPALQIRIRGLAAYLRDFGELEEARFRLIAGEAVCGAEFPPMDREGAPGADIYQFPEARKPLFYDEDLDQEEEHEDAMEEEEDIEHESARQDHGYADAKVEAMTYEEVKEAMAEEAVRVGGRRDWYWRLLLRHRSKLRILDNISHMTEDEVEEKISKEQESSHPRDWYIEALVERLNELAANRRG